MLSLQVHPERRGHAEHPLQPQGGIRRDRLTFAHQAFDPGPIRQPHGLRQGARREAQRRHEVLPQHLPRMGQGLCEVIIENAGAHPQVLLLARSVIVAEPDLFRPVDAPDEHDPELVVHADRPPSFEISRQAMEPIAWRNRHLLNGRHRVQLGQQAAGLSGEGRPESLWASGLRTRPATPYSTSSGSSGLFVAHDATSGK